MFFSRQKPVFLRVTKRGCLLNQHPILESNERPLVPTHSTYHWREAFIHGSNHITLIINILFLKKSSSISFSISLMIEILTL